MDATIISTIAAATVSLISSYLQKAGEDFAKKTGEELGKKAGASIWVNAKRAFGIVREKLRYDPVASQTLQSLETLPKNQEAQAAIKLKLKELMYSDEDLTNELTAIVTEIAESHEAGAFFDTAILGDVKKFIQIGSVYGDVNL